MQYRWLILLSLFCFSEFTLANSQRTIVVSIPPLQFLMEKIVGEDVNVISLVPENDSPELFQPTLKQIIKIKQADLYFSLGLPFEQKWIRVLSENSNLQINTDCCSELKTLTHSKHHHHDHAADPHIWTDPILLIEIARSMLVELNKVYPENSQTYKQSFDILVSELQELDHFIKQQLQPFEENMFIVTHPAWSYYAKRYGLEQISLEQEGKEIGIQARKKILEQAESKNIKYIFSIDQLHSKSANAIANELNAQIIFIDPLAYDYVANLQSTTHKLVQSFQN